MALLERETELAALDEALVHAAAGAGALVLVEGQAGQGKSALVAAARARAATRGMRVRSARGAVLEREFAFGALRQLLEPSTAPPSAETLAGLAADGPLLLAIDDAHWGDVESLGVLTALAARLDGLPVAVVAALRPAEPGAEQAALDALCAVPAAVRLAPRSLGPDAVATAVRERVPGAGRVLCVEAFEATRGNPLLLHELLLAAAPGGVAPAPGALRRTAVPSLADRVARRVARIDPAAPALVDALAVLGDGAELAVAAQLAGVEADRAAQMAEALCAIEVLGAAAPVAFAHPLVRRSLHDRIPATDREAVHLRAAGLLRAAGAGVEAVASQLAATTPRGDPDVAATLLEAGRHALARGAPDAAVRWLERGMAEGASDPDPATVAAELAVSEVVRRSPIALERLDDAHARAGDPAARTRLAVAIADTAMLLGRWDRAIGAVGAARAELPPGDQDAEAELTAIGVMASGYLRGGAFRVDEARLEQLVAAPGWGAHALAAVLAARAANAGDIARARPLIDRALADGALLGDRLPTTWAVAQATAALAALDRLEHALAFSRALVDAAVAQGAVGARHTGTDLAAWIQARVGDLAAAEAEIRPGLEIGRAMGAVTVTVTQLFYVQDAVLERPGFVDAADLVLAIDADAVTGTSSDAMLHCVRGRIRLARRERAQAVADLGRALDVADALSFGPTVAPFRSLLALALPSSRREEAQALVADELRAARATGLPRPEGVALRSAGLLADGEEAIELLGAAAALLGRSPARLEHARALIAQGAALRRAHRRGEARDPLTEGLALAEACGARAVAERAREELRAAGGSPTSQRGPGRDQLTPSELRVVRRAAEGAANVEIAQELFVSLKTVETHLTSAYAKLGLSGRGSRGRLAEALEASG